MGNGQCKDIQSCYESCEINKLTAEVANIYPQASFNIMFLLFFIAFCLATKFL